MVASQASSVPEKAHFMLGGKVGSTLENHRPANQEDTGVNGKNNNNNKNNLEEIKKKY